MTSGLTQGKTFPAICAEAKRKPLELPAFSLSTRSFPSAASNAWAEVEEHLTLDQLKHLAFSTPAGKVSNFRETPEGGVILRVKFKLSPDEARMRAELPSFYGYVRQTRQNEVFNEWFSREAQKGLRDTPLGQQKQAPSISPRQRKA